MRQREIVVDLVKAAFVALLVKVMASYSILIPWPSLADNLCIVFAISVMLIKLCRLTLPLKKLLALAAISLFVLYTSVSMDIFDPLVTMITIILLIDEDLEEYIALMLKIQAWFLITHIAISGALSLFGKFNLFWFVADNRLRFLGGFLHSNILSCYINSCMLMFAWLRFRHITPNQFGWMFCITILSFLMSKSRTGLILNLFLLLLIYLNQNENRLIQKSIDGILLVLFPTLCALILLATKQYAAGSSLARMLDGLMTGRIKYAAYAYLRSGTTLLPRYLEYANSGFVTWTEEWSLNTFTFDNLYSFFFMQMGMIWIGVFFGLLVLVCRKFDFRNKLFILFFLLFSIVEVHGLNCFNFFPLMLFSTILSRKGAEDHSICNA